MRGKKTLNVIQVRVKGSLGKQSNSGQIQEILDKKVIQVMCPVALELFDNFPSN